MFTSENNKTRSTSPKPVWFGDGKYPDISMVRHYFEPYSHQPIQLQPPDNQLQPPDNHPQPPDNQQVLDDQHPVDDQQLDDNSKINETKILYSTESINLLDPQDPFDLLDSYDSLGYCSELDTKKKIEDKYILIINDVANSIDKKMRSTDVIRFRLETAINIKKTI